VLRRHICENISSESSKKVNHNIHEINTSQKRRHLLGKYLENGVCTNIKSSGVAGLFDEDGIPVSDVIVVERTQAVCIVFEDSIQLLAGSRKGAVRARREVNICVLGKVSLSR
jgi:hypothetical protein